MGRVSLPVEAGSCQRGRWEVSPDTRLLGLLFGSFVAVVGRERFPHTEDDVIRALARVGLEFEAPFADRTAGRGRRTGAGQHHKV